MSTKVAKTVRKQMWYGLNATVTIGPGFWHNAGFGAFSIPHPPVVNWLLRRGLAEDARFNLSITHEFGHLQTLPFAIFYTGTMLFLVLFTIHTGIIEIITVLISTHAAWEMMAEISTITGDVSLYREYYDEITVIPRIIFWIFTGTLTITGWFVILF